MSTCMEIHAALLLPWQSCILKYVTIFLLQGQKAATVPLSAGAERL